MSWVATVFVAAVWVAAVVGLVLTAPRPNDLRGYYCVRDVKLTERLGHPLNCDSPMFVRLAKDPAGLLAPKSRRQSRPLYVVAGWGVGAALSRVGSLGLPGFLADSYYLAYILVNFGTLVLAVLLFCRLVVPDRLASLGVLSLASLLVANDVVKAFFWTPHTQMFNVLAPVVAIALVRWAYLHPGAPCSQAASVGALAGALFLVYGSFLIIPPAVTLGLVFGGRRSAAPIGAGRIAARIVCVGAGFVVLPAVWWLIVRGVTEGFHSHEIERYRQFVWILDAWHAGVEVLGRRSLANAGRFLATFVPVIAPPAGLVLATAVAARLARVRLGNVFGDHRPTVVAAVVVFCVVTGFCAAMGFYKPRLAWNAVPPVLILAAVLVDGIERHGTRAAATRIRVALGVTAVTWLGYVVTKVGPFA